MKTERLTRVVDERLIRQELMYSMVFRGSVQNLATLPVYVIGSQSRPYYQREGELAPGILLLVNEHNVLLQIFIVGAPEPALKAQIQEKIAMVTEDYGDFLVCWIKTPGTLAPFRTIIPHDHLKPTLLLLDSPSALRQASHARFFVETTLTQGQFPEIAEFAARYGDIIYSFDEVGT